MVYIEYPHIDLVEDDDLKLFQEDAKKKAAKCWTNLFGYSRKHTTRFDISDLAPHKCFYSEAPL